MGYYMQFIKQPVRVVFGALFVLVAVAFAAPDARADMLDDAKAAGVVGERQDGYLGIVSGGSVEIQRLVQDINLRRRDRYKQIADSTSGSTLSDVETLAGAKLIQQMPAGQFYQSSSGAWVRK